MFYFVFQVFLRILSPMLCICSKHCIRPISRHKAMKSSALLHHANSTDCSNRDADSYITITTTTTTTAMEGLKEPTDCSEPLLSPTSLTTSTEAQQLLINGTECIRLLERWLSRLETQVQDVSRSLGRILRLVETKRQETSHSRMLTQEWRQVAKVMDRFFVIVYFIVIVLSILYLFPLPKKVFWYNQ